MPVYLLPFVGVAKVLGIIAILLPNMARLKEWAYAGLTFDLIGAACAIVASGKPEENLVRMLFFIALAFGSHYCYHQKLKAYALAQINKNLPANTATCELHTF